MAASAVSVSRACSTTSRPGKFTKQKATLHPSFPNSITTARPSPVAPPVTTATFPLHPLRTGCGSGSSSTAPLASGASYSHDGRWPKPKDGKGMESEGTARPGGGQEGSLPSRFTLHSSCFTLLLHHAPQ